MTNLKPCPFCGKVPTVYGAKSREYASGRWAKGHREAYWVHPRCELGCLMGTAHAAAYGATRGIEFTTEEAAIEAWNNRAERTCHHVDDGVPWCDEEFTCSECGATTNITMSSLLTISEGELHYCPNCGAKVATKDFSLCNDDNESEQ